MKTYRITMILVALTWTAAAMTTPIDSLYRRICSTPRADIGEVNRLLMLLDADGITDSLIQHDRHAPREGMMAATHLYMADYFYDRQADMTATIQAARRAEQAACRAQDTLRIEEALAYQAVAASRMGQIDVALKATKEELRLDSLSGQRPNLARAYNTLAGLSLQAGRTDDARLYVRKAIEIERTLEDTSHLGVRYGLAAEIYAKTGELDRALDYALGDLDALSSPGMGEWNPDYFRVLYSPSCDNLRTLDVFARLWVAIFSKRPKTREHDLERLAKVGGTFINEFMQMVSLKL